MSCSQREGGCSWVRMILLGKLYGHEEEEETDQAEQPSNLSVFEYHYQFSLTAFLVIFIMRVLREFSSPVRSTFLMCCLLCYGDLSALEGIWIQA